MRDMDTALSCVPPVRFRSSVLTELAIRPLLRGKPNELDVVYLAASHHTARRNQFFHRSAESLTSCIGYLLFGAVGRVLSVKLGADMLEVAGAYFRTIGEWTNYLPAMIRASGHAGGAASTVSSAASG